MLNKNIDDLKNRLVLIYESDTMTIEQKMAMAEEVTCQYVQGFGFDLNTQAAKIREQYLTWRGDFSEEWAENKLREYLNACAFEYVLRTDAGQRAIFDGLLKAFERNDEEAHWAWLEMKAFL